MMCPVCKDKGGILGVEVAFPYSLYECSRCALVFSDPMKAAGADYYKRDITYQAPSENNVELHYRAACSKSNRRLLRMVRPGDATLDIGCGFGAFVRVAADFGFDAYGIDFNDVSVEVGRRVLGLASRLHVGGVDEFDVPSNYSKYGLVSMFEVIEHVDRPLELLESVSRILRPGGLLAISCPNEERWQPAGRVFVDYPPHHLTRWSPRTLRSCLERIGYKHVYTELDSSFRDVLWVHWVNKRAAERMHSAGELGLLTSAARKRLPCIWKLRADALVRLVLSPFDLGLRVLGIGTMGMKMVVRWPGEE